MVQWSRRENLLATAQLLKVSVRPSATEDEIRRAVDAAPATPRQLLVLADALPAGRTLPAGMTYGRARVAVQKVMEILNELAIAELKLQPGAIIYRSGKYYYVVSIARAADHYQVRLTQVSLSRAQGERTRYKRVARREFNINPVNLRYTSAVVDLDTWQPTYSFRPRVNPNEPLL